MCTQKSGSVKETNSLRTVGSPWMLDARTQEATKGGNDGGPRTTSAAVRSFVLISRLLIKPQPPKNKARKGEGEKMEGRVGIFPYAFPYGRGTATENWWTGGETMERLTMRADQRNEGRWRGRELKRMKRQVKRERERY